MEWNERLIEKAQVLIGGLMNDYLPDMHKAFMRLEPNDKGETPPLVVSIGLKINGEGDDLSVLAEFSFIAEKIKDKAEGRVSAQMELPPTAPENDETGETEEE